MTITLRDIAKRVGVSISAVSLVLNGNDQGRVSPRTAATIRRVAEEMEYLPNLMGRALKIGKSRTLGVLAEGIATSPFSGEMLAGAQEVAWEAGYQLIVIDIGKRTPELIDPAIRALLQRNVQAVIIATDCHRETAVPATDPDVPIVLLNASPAGDAAAATAGWVVPDEQQGAFDAVNHLIKAGHRHIGWCGIPESQYLAAKPRLEGYKQALKAAGIALDPSLLVTANGPLTVDGREAAKTLLSRPHRPSAVFCFSDRLAMAFYQYAHELGICVPHQLSIVGFDNQRDIADALIPGLSTMHLPYRSMGQWAVRAALDALKDESKVPAIERHKRCQCPLISRESVAGPSVPITASGAPHVVALP